MDGPAVVKVFDGQFNPINILLIIRHSVQSIPQRSIGSTPRPQPLQECIGLRHAACRSCNMRI
jgi:hypothetical protein